MRSQLLDRSELPLAPRQAAAAERPTTQTILLAPLFLLLLSAAAVGAALWLRATQPFPETWVVRLWAGALGAFLAACWLRDRDRAEVRPLGLGWTAGDTLLLLAALGVGLALRVVSIGHAPSTMLGDEGQMASAAREVLGGQRRDPFTTGWLSHPTLWFFLQSGSMRVFGDGLGGARMLSALIGGATVVTTYLLARLLYGRPIALIAALLLATYHLHIHFSRLALNNIGDPLFGTLILLWVACGLRTRRWLMYGLAGVTLGLALYFYHGARVFYLLLALLGLASLCLQRARWSSRAERRHACSMLLLLAAGALLAAAPLLQTFAWNPSAFTLRFEAVGVTASWLQQKAQERGETPAQVLLDQLRHAAGAFHSYPDAYGFYDHRQPLLWGAGQLLLPLGLLIALARSRRWAYQAPLAWLALTVIFGGMLFRYTPGSPRFLTLAPVVALLNAFALDGVYRLLCRARRLRRPALAGLVLAVAALCLASPARYFDDYLRHERLGGAVTHRANTLARYLESQPAGTRLWLADADGLRPDLPLIRFLAPQVEGKAISAPIASQSGVPVARPGLRTIYAVAPSRLAELALIERRYPGGAREELRWLDSPQPLLYAYAVEIAGSTGFRPAPSCLYLPSRAPADAYDC